VRAAATKCKILKFAELPIMMSGEKPLVSAQINGADARFVLDTGAFYSMMSSASAQQFNLRLGPAPFGLRVGGIGGSTAPSLANVKVFTFAGVPIRDIDFLVGGSEVGQGAAGLLGQNFLEKWDEEYDLANGVVRFFKPEDCQHVVLAYWASAEHPPSTMDIGVVTFMKPYAMGTAYINGAKIKVMFDSGAASSMMSSRAAADAGVKPGLPGVEEAGYSRGIGRAMVKTYIAHFANFKIGDNEEIKNARLRFADTQLGEADMLLGADFFLSHHLYISNYQHRVYFTYNGGPVFNLSKQAADKGSGDAAQAAEPSDVKDAAALARLGAASAGRHDYGHAVEEFTRALELDPAGAEYAYQRGMAYRNDKQPIPAAADFDQALELNPDHLEARVARAQLRMANRDLDGAIADLDAADRIAAKQADVRFTLAELYGKAGRLPSALTQWDLWISNHPDDSKMGGALNNRCWAKTLLGQDLPHALSDCNAAYHRSEKSSPLRVRILENRGLVRLRLGDYDQAIADYDEALKLEPNSAGALYGRGIARLRRKKTAEGESDIAAAVRTWPQVADEFQRRGIAP
jgi:tetratricopeptide (TPR) repeat protein